MFYFNSYKTEMESVTTDGNKEVVKGREEFLKLPAWVSDIPKIVGMGLFILLMVGFYSEAQGMLG